uniref:GRIP domain-containing protein n=1 Tax=Anopheles atroparvus TaxID=41427 RepID=A0A182JIJ4_ANOAO
MNTSQGSEQDSARKPSPFDSLSREDLVKKCKGLLGIAQKAKQVKDECLEENRRLKEQLSHFETQKNADKECIKAMQEVADSYMDQKLQATMKVDELGKQLEKMKAQLVNEQTQHEKANEQLREDIAQLKKQLVEFEQNAEDRQKDAAADRMKELEEENAKLEKERVTLEQELIKVKGSQPVLADSTQSAKEEKLIRKLKLYKAKVQEINAKLLLLKSDRKILLKTVKEYSEQVPKWQKELVNASNVLFDKIRTIELEKSDLVEQLSKQEKILNDLHAENMASERATHEKNASKMEENQAIVQKLIVENENLEAQLGQLAEKLKSSIAKSKQAMERNKQLEEELESAKKKWDDLAKEKKLISDELKQAQDQEAAHVKKITLRLNEKCSMVTELEHEKEKLQHALSEAESKHQQYQESVDNEMQQRLSDLEKELVSANGKQDVLKSENGELLAELKEINEILKERGEIINLQVSKISELQEKLSRVETTDVEPLKQQIEQLQQALAEKDTELEKQRDELASMKDRPNMSFDAQSDVMSTSTISRVEDVARMREIDESFEEKYIKLRSLAVKLKKKVAEQTVLLQKYEKEASTTAAAAAAVAAAGVASSAAAAVDTAQQTVSKNLQTLQAENDRLEDQLETLRQEMAKLREELDRKTVELATLEQLQKDAEGTSKDRTALESAIREYQTQIQSLKREKDAFQLAKRENDAENQRLKTSLKAKEKELADEQELQKELKSELDRTRLAVKKANVLSLEMEAYERSLSELNTKLEGKKTLVRELEGTIDLQEQSMKSLKHQVALLEESLESQQKHSREMKQEADTMQGKLRQSEHQRMELSGQLEELRDEHDRLKQRVENNRIELEQVAAEKEQVCGALEVEKNNLLKKNLALEDELSVLRKAKVEIQQEVEDVRTEFASYKIRAQSVLRQNQSKESCREKELEEELGQVQRSLEAVEAKQQILMKQNGDLSRVNEELRSEKDRTQNRCKELLGLLEESRLQNESLLEESRKVNLEHQETLKTQRIQNETLVQCYKKQLDDVQKAHCLELEQLQASMRHRTETTTDGPSIARANLHNNNSFVPIQHTLAGARAGDRSGFTDEQRISLLLMEREEGEGSESTSLGTAVAGTSGAQRRSSIKSSSSLVRGRSNRDVIPLDELLNSSFDDTASVVLGDGEGEQQSASFFGRESSPTVELQHTKEQLSKQESRVRHLTAVLAEAEQDLAKLTQLNELLKEEVRRQQRSIEREAHVHNSEYLKNVIFKVLKLELVVGQVYCGAKGTPKVLRVVPFPVK